MKEISLKENERLDELQRNGYQIIQNPEKFCFGIDAVLRIGNRNYDELAEFLKKLNALSEDAKAEFIITVSADESELPASIFEIAEKL